jgi:hypothetical protein
MPTETTSSLENLTDEEREKILEMVAKRALTEKVLRQRKAWDEKKAAKAGQSQTNSTSKAKPKQS